MRYPITATEGSIGTIPKENLNYSVKNTRIIIYKDGEKVLDKEFIKEPNKNYCISTDNDMIDVIPDDVEEVCNVGTMLPQGMGPAHTKNITPAGVAKEVDVALMPTALYPSSPDIMNLENATKEDLSRIIDDLKYEKANGLISKEELVEKYNIIKEKAMELAGNNSVTESANDVMERPSKTVDNYDIDKMFAYIEYLLDSKNYDEDIALEYDCDPELIKRVRYGISYEKVLNNFKSNSDNAADLFIVKEAAVHNECEKRNLIKDAPKDARSFIEAFDMALRIKESDLDDEEKETELEKLKEEYYNFGRDNDTPENRKHKEYLRQRIKMLELQDAKV